MEISGSKSPRSLIESLIGWKNRIFQPKNGFGPSGPDGSPAKKIYGVGQLYKNLIKNYGFPKKYKKIYKKVL